MTVVSIRLSIPDNEARTAFTTLRRLGVEISGLERTRLLLIEGVAHDPHTVAAAVRADEALFNGNTDELEVRIASEPGAGELWIIDETPQTVMIANIGTARCLTAWRLYETHQQLADESRLQQAADVLLCNPAMQKRIGRLQEQGTNR